MNKIILIGRLCREPSLSHKNDTAICKFHIAVDKPYSKDKDAGADFIPIVFFGKRAEAIAKHFHKGNKIAIYGRLETNTYVKNDEKRYSFNIIGNEFEFCESKNKNAAEGEADFLEDTADEEDIPF